MELDIQTAHPKKFAELSAVQNRRRGGGGYNQPASRRVGGLSGLGGLSGQGSSQYNSFMGGLVGGEFENPDRVLTGQVATTLSL